MSIYYELIASAYIWSPVKDLNMDMAETGFIVHSEKLVHADFNPDGVCEGTFASDEPDSPILCAQWNNDQDCYDTVEIKREDAICWRPKPAAPLMIVEDLKR